MCKENAFQYKQCPEIGDYHYEVFVPIRLVVHRYSEPGQGHEDRDHKYGR